MKRINNDGPVSKSRKIGLSDNCPRIAHRNAVHPSTKYISPEMSLLAKECHRARSRMSSPSSLTKLLFRHTCLTAKVGLRTPIYFHPRTRNGYKNTKMVIATKNELESTESIAAEKVLTTEPAVLENDDDATADDRQEENPESRGVPPTPTTPVKKFGFGAGMRMYAKSLAQAEEEAKATQPDVEPEVVAQAKADEETEAHDKAVDLPKETEAPVDESREPESAAAETEDVVELLSEDENTSSEGKAVPACSVYQNFVDSISFLFRKAEEGLDDAHERVCSREVSCQADVPNEIIENDDDVVAPEETSSLGDTNGAPTAEESESTE